MTPDSVLASILRTDKAGNARPLPFGKASRRKGYDRVPYGAIDWVCGRRHVLDPYRDIVEDMLGRLWHTSASRQELMEACRYACATHHDNRSLYYRVTSGRL